MASHYSSDLVRVTQALLASSPDKSEGVGISSIRQLNSVLADRMFGEVNVIRDSWLHPSYFHFWCNMYMNVAEVAAEGSILAVM